MLPVGLTQGSSDMSSVSPSSRFSKIAELLNESGNSSCADCGMKLSVSTAWAVLSYGIFVCEDCKLVHIQQENHYKAFEDSATQENTASGILPTSAWQPWNEKDIEQIKANGNDKVNLKLLSNTPVWQYRPTANDGIKHKEYWINYKYAKKENTDEVPKIAGKSFIGIQFTRPMTKGNFPCCAVLQKEILYLTSDVKNEEIPIERIETLLLNSKRIGHENGVQLTYRTTTGSGNGSQNGVTYTYLQHDNMETVLDWINLVLYSKYNLLKNKYSNHSQASIANMLNCAMIKESYMTAQGGLVYMSLSEARIACFSHHLDDKPLFHLPITKAMNFSAEQYLDAVAHFFSMDVAKMYGYEEWIGLLEDALGLNKLSHLPDDAVKPSVTTNLLPPVKKISPALVNEDILPVPKINSTPEPVAVPAVTAVPIQRDPVNNRNDMQGKKDFFKDEREEKPAEKSKKSYECYPPIGPMGEMGKVARGELPPEAIKPPPSKTDLARAQIFGMMTANPPMTMATHTMMTSPPIGNMNPTLSQQALLQNNVDCYPPISGPIRDMVKAVDMFQGRPSRDDNYPVIDEFKPHHNSGNSSAIRNQDVGFGTKMGNTFSDAEMSQFSRLALNNGGWIGDGDNLLTIPWKQTRNGYEPARGFSQMPYEWNKRAGLRSPPEITPQQATLGRSASWNPTSGRSMEQWHMKHADAYYGQMKSQFPRSSGSQEHVIMENLQQLWSSAERKLLALIHNGYVPASNMTAAGLDADSVDHAQTCISELFDLLWKQRYDLALSFLRGFREVFSRSGNHDIRNRFIGVGELDTMKQIFLQQGREKFSRANAGAPINWKQQPSPSPTNVEQTWPITTTAGPRESPTDFTPWGPLSPAVGTPSDGNMSGVWGLNSGMHTNSTTSVSSDPWNLSGNASSTSQPASTASYSFNRAPSRPISLTRSSFSENSPTEGSFESKTSSNSTSPRVATPPSSLDACITSAALTGIETTLKNLFLNSNASGSSLWN